MSLNFKLYFVAFLGFVVADSIWIGLIMKKFYMEQMMSFGRIFDGKFEPVLWAALVVYVVLALGVVDFVLAKATVEKNFLSVFLTGAFLGLVIYGTYDFTNHATIKDWSLTITFIDVIWGMLVTGFVSVVTKYASGVFGS